MVKSLIVHIGMPKAGSTAIQRFLDDNTTPLAAFGIAFVKAGRGRQPIQHAALHTRGLNLLSDSPISDTKRALVAEQWEQVKAEIIAGSASTYVVSMEGLYPTLINDSAIYRSWFYELRQHCEVKICVYLRRQDLWVESLFSQFSKGDHPSRASHDIIDMWHKLDDKGYLNYDHNLSQLSTLDTDQIIVRPFETVQLVGGDVATDFMNVLGVQDLSTFSNSLKANVAFPRGDTIFLHTSKRLGLHPEARELVLNNQSPFAVPEQPRYILAPIERVQLLAPYQAGNNRIAHEYLGHNRLFLANPNSEEDPYWSPPISPTPEEVKDRLGLHYLSDRLP